MEKATEEHSEEGKKCVEMKKERQCGMDRGEAEISFPSSLRFW